MKNEDKDTTSTWNKIAFGFGQIGDMVSYQTFTIMIFVFYYGAIGINSNWIMIGFIIWSIWNSINDPLLGIVSDRTKKKMGRRRFWIIIATIPTAIIMILLWTPPLLFGITSGTVDGMLLNFIYFLVVICIFDFFYTMFSLNATSVFPEMFLYKKERNKAAMWRNILSIIGLIIAFLLPIAIIGDTKDPVNLFNLNYFIASVIISTIFIICEVIFIKWGLKERAEFKEDPAKNPGFLKSLKICLTNKSFLIYVLANLGNWYVYGLIPTIILLYGQWVIFYPWYSGETDIFMSIGLLFAFIVGGILQPLWKKIGLKLGNRKGAMIGFAAWGAAFIPFLFVGRGWPFYFLSLILMVFAGVGIGASLYFKDLLMSEIIDEDEVKSGVRREGTYYGVNALIIRLATIFVIISINIVFNGASWEIYQPGILDPTLFIIGLKSLMSIFPAVACALVILCLYFYPIHDDRLLNIKKELAKMHQVKRDKSNLKSTSGKRP
ncbi:MAG: MFS transporter [Candidatus Lokiarchaeota archaeon]|nr:MFS transporter [Candidatus Lokiarchaeota archaeon]